MSEMTMQAGMARATDANEWIHPAQSGGTVYWLQMTSSAFLSSSACDPMSCSTSGRQAFDWTKRGKLSRDSTLNA